MMWQTLSALSLLSLAGVSVSAKGLRYDQGPAQANSAQIPFIVPGKFIVEFQDDNFGENIVDRFFGDLTNKGIRPMGGLNFTSSPIFKGCSFRVDKKTNPAHILALDMVKNIWPVKRVAAPKPRVVQKGASAKAPKWTSHAGTGVLDMHKRGYLGEGVVVAIIDTGIDYTNPGLGGSIGPGKKIISGWDFVGDDWSPGGKAAPDNNIMDCQGHGTHVAGIVAGEPEDGRFISVAPKAKLRGYKVFGCSGGTDTDTLVAAFLKAEEDGVDIINASIVGPEGWTEGVWQVTADRLVKKGIFIAIAAGNEGEVGSWYAASGATGIDVLSVASIDNEQLYVAAAEARSGNEKKAITYIDAGEGIDGWQLNKELEVYATSLNTSEAADACAPLPDSTPDLKGKLVVVRRGSCTFEEKGKNIAAKGGQYLMFYTDDRPATQADAGNTTIGYIGMLDAPIGAYLVNSFAAKKKTSVFFPTNGGVTIPNTATGGHASDYTQWGPSWEAYMKPEIGAPGGDILSTYPMNKGEYAVLSGTSMATPYISGIAALYFGKAGGRKNLGDRAAVELKGRMISSGRALKWNDGVKTHPDKYAPIAQIGGGYVNATKVLTYDTSVSPAKLELNDTMYFKSEHSITVKNSGHSLVTYTVTHLPVDTFYTFEPGYTTPMVFPPNLVKGVASVQFSEAVCIVAPGMENSFKVTFTPPQGLNKTLLPVYGGKIVITGNNGERLEIPYLGIDGSIKAQKIWDLGWNIPQIKSKEMPIDQPHNFTLQGDDRPIFTYINDWGSREIRVDVVTADWTESDWSYPPVAEKNRFVGSIVTADADTYPSYFETRHNSFLPDQEHTQFNWTGTISNGLNQTQIKPGKYRFNMRALKVFGNPELVGDWQSVTSPVITVLDVSKHPAP